MFQALKATDTAVMVLLAVAACVVVVGLLAGVVWLLRWAFAPSDADKLRAVLARPKPPEPDPIEFVRDGRPQPEDLTHEERQRLKAIAAGNVPPAGGPPTSTPASAAAPGTATPSGTPTASATAPPAADLAASLVASVEAARKAAGK